MRDNSPSPEPFIDGPYPDAERILVSHDATGYELPDGRLRVLDLWTRPYPPLVSDPSSSLEVGQTWLTIERKDLPRWLGY